MPRPYHRLEIFVPSPIIPQDLKPLNRDVWQLQRTTTIVLIHICILEVETAVVRYDSGLIYVNGCKPRIPVLWSSREGVGRGHEECGLSC